MISDISIGQYFPGNSFLHKMDPRMKIVLIILFMVSIFIGKNYFCLGLVFAVSLITVLASRISLKSILKSIKPLIIIILFTGLLNLFYGSGEPLVKFWIFKITADGINKAVFMAARIIMLVVIGSMLTYTTTPTALTDAMESLMKPLKVFKVDVHSIAITMTIALRFIPTLTEEVDKIMSAQKSRGADLESGGLIKRAKAIVPIIIPLFISSFRRANELAYAMECRCYRGGSGRTKMKIMKLHSGDYVCAVIFVLYFVGIIVINHFAGAVI